MKDIVTETIKIENEGVSVEVADNSTQINIEKKLSGEDVNKLLHFIESLDENSPKEEKKNGRREIDWESKFDEEAFSRNFLIVTDCRGRKYVY